MNTKPLDFICIGAPKAGTTSLHDVLTKHPEVCLPIGKEIPAFWGLRSKRDVIRVWENEVINYYRCRNGENKYGMIVPYYWNDIKLPIVLKEAFPELKYIIVLRDPVQRLISEYRMIYRHGETTLSFYDFVKKGMELFEISDKEDIRAIYSFYPLHAVMASFYSERLNIYFSRLGKQNVHVVIFEDFIRNPQVELKALLRFLGVNENVDLKLSKRNQGSVNKIKGVVVQTIFQVYKFAIRNETLRKIGKKFLGKFKYALWFWMVENRAKRFNEIKISSEVIDMLYEYFAVEIKQTEKILRKTLPWKYSNEQ